MPEVPAGIAIAGEPTGLGAQVLADEMAALEQTGPKIEGKQENPEPSNPEDDKQRDSGKVEEPKAEEPKEGDEPKPEEPKPEEPKDATVKIGKQEFASAADALKEATRIMGRNAELSGALKQAETRAVEASRELEGVKAQLDEALKVNQKWAEYHEKVTAGESAEPPRDNQPSVEETVRKVMSEQESARAEAERLAAVRAEFDKVQAAPNYPEVAETVYRVADQINPLTGRYFTPKEAYEYACRMAGLPSELDGTPPAPTPKPPVNPAVKASAARPSGSGRAPAAAPKQETTVEDEYLSRAFPL